MAWRVRAATPPFPVVRGEQSAAGDDEPGEHQRRQPNPRRAPIEDGLPDGLTAREAEVLGLITAGLSNAEIAAELFIGEATVKTHINNAFAKIGVRNRVQAMRYAVQHGLER